MKNTHKSIDNRYLIALGIAVTLLLVVLAAAAQPKNDVSHAGPVDTTTQQNTLDQAQQQNIPGTQAQTIYTESIGNNAGIDVPADVITLNDKSGMAVQ
jgi:hypothetical protein